MALVDAERLENYLANPALHGLRPQAPWSSKPATPDIATTPPLEHGGDVNGAPLLGEPGVEDFSTPPSEHGGNGNAAPRPVNHSEEESMRPTAPEEVPADAEDPQEPDGHTQCPEHYYIGSGKSWVTVSGARLRLLEGGGERGAEGNLEASQALQSLVDATHPEAGCSCGSSFLPDSDFCHKCGTKRPGEIADLEVQKKAAIAREDFIEAQRIKSEIEVLLSQAGDASHAPSQLSPSGPSSFASASAGGTPKRRGRMLADLASFGGGVKQVSANHLLATPATPATSNGSNFGLPSYQEKMRLEYQDLAREVFDGQASEAQTEARLDLELTELKNRSTEEANAINDVCQQIGDAAFLKDELRQMDEARHLLQAELVGEENHRQVWEAEQCAEEEELHAHLQARQHQVAEMAESRRSMQLHLQRMASTQAWLCGDIEEVRRTRSSAEATGQRELAERGEEIERVNSELHVLIQEHRSDHDSWWAQTESEVFRLSQESKRQDLEEQELAESIELAKSEHTEACSQLRENVESCANRNVELEQEIRQALQECKQQSDVERPRCMVEESRLEADFQTAEQERAEILSQLLFDEDLCAQAEQRANEQSRWELAEASSSKMSAVERKNAKRWDQELTVLRRDIQQAENLQAELRDDLKRSEASRGIFNCARRRQPQLPPPPTSPIDTAKRPPAMQDMV